MPSGVAAIRDGQLRQLEAMRCNGCGRMLLRIDAEALKPGKVVEVKCGKCDFMNYRIGRST
jgi:phage FluMu protein Com